MNDFFTYVAKKFNAAWTYVQKIVKTSWAWIKKSTAALKSWASANVSISIDSETRAIHVKVTTKNNTWLLGVPQKFQRKVLIGGAVVALAFLGAAALAGINAAAGDVVVAEGSKATHSALVKFFAKHESVAQAVVAMSGTGAVAAVKKTGDVLFTENPNGEWVFEIGGRAVASPVAA